MKLKVNDLKLLFLEGKSLTFDITNHKRIPNVVLCNNFIIGEASIATINSFKRWKRNNIG